MAQESDSGITKESGDWDETKEPHTSANAIPSHPVVDAESRGEAWNDFHMLKAPCSHVKPPRFCCGDEDIVKKR